MQLPEYISKDEVKRICRELKLKDWSKLKKPEVSAEDARKILAIVKPADMDIPLEDFRVGLEVELEHGTQFADANVTNNHPILTGKIVLAHLYETMDYYKRLEVAEIEGDILKALKAKNLAKVEALYRKLAKARLELSEEEAYPALPDNEYGWEKLYAERMAMAYGRRYGMAVRIARFQNTYGPEGTWEGGREKAPAALCRKIAEAPDGGEIEVWGDGTAMRAYTYIDDLLDGIILLVHSDLEDGVNIGRKEYVSVDGLAQTVARVAGKRIRIKHVPGPVGVEARNFRNDRISSLGWTSRVSLKEGLSRTYPWVRSQVEARKK